MGCNLLAFWLRDKKQAGQFTCQGLQRSKTQRSPTPKDTETRPVRSSIKVFLFTSISDDSKEEEKHITPDASETLAQLKVNSQAVATERDPGERLL